MSHVQKKAPAAADTAGRGNDQIFGDTEDNIEAGNYEQLDAHLDTLEFCCRKHWITILSATHRGRSNGRNSVVIHQDGELIAWATWWGQLDLWHIIVLPGGRRWYRYDTLWDFLRIVGDELEVETTDELVKLWGAP